MSGSLIIQPFAANGDVVDIPQTDANGFVNWSLGYTPFYEIEIGSNNPQAKAVERTVQNRLFKIATENIQALQQLGFPEWYASMPGGYVRNAHVQRLGGDGIWRPYRSLAAGNQSDPLTSPTWAYIQTAAENTATVPMPSGGSGGATTALVTAAKDFNSFGVGTWEFTSDAIAASSAHGPAVDGATTLAGMLESMAWTGGSTSYATQRYLDRSGNSFFRGSLNGIWTAWVTTVPKVTFSADTSTTANLVSATFPLSSAVIADNAQFWVAIKTANNGASTFTPNPNVITTPLPVIGGASVALQGGELVAGGRALFVYKADVNSFLLEFASGGGVQVANATKTQHAVNLGQLNAAILAVPIGVTYLNASQTVNPGTYAVDTSAGPITITVNAALTSGYTFIDAANTWGINALTVNGNGNSIGALPSNITPTFVADVSDYQFSMIATTSYWRLV